jgi:hypothetical protein
LIDPPPDTNVQRGEEPDDAAPPSTDADSSSLPVVDLPILSRRGLKAALRETAIVVLGVLIALWVNNWNGRRTEERLEREYLSRLAEDLHADTAMIRQMLQVAEDKAVGLQIIAPWLRSATELPDTIRFLRAVIGSASLSWAHPPVRRTTFQELENTGDLRLISDARLRALVISYYFFAADEANRVDQRRTGYGRLSYQLVPHRGYGMLGIQRDEEAGGSTDATYLEGLSGSERRRLVDLTRSSGLADLVQAEENFARFFSRSQAEVQKRAIALLNEVEAGIR